MERENARLKERLAAFEKEAVDNSLIEREIDFLNEQLEDADLYIQNMMGLLEEKAQTIEQETSKRRELESRFENISREIHEKAKLDVKVSILERDLGISTTRLKAAPNASAARVSPTGSTARPAPPKSAAQA